MYQLKLLSSRRPQSSKICSAGFHLKFFAQFLLIVSGQVELIYLDGHISKEIHPRSQGLTADTALGKKSRESLNPPLLYINRSSPIQSPLQRFCDVL